MDKANDNYYKSHASDFIKKIKCNNINANLNGDIRHWCITSSWGSSN